MELKKQYTVEEVIEIVNTFSLADKKKVEVEIRKSMLNENEILQIINPIHKKFEETYKALA